jgi:hypothetical protein
MSLSFGIKKFAIGSGNEERYFPFVAQDLKLLANFLGDKGIMRLFLAHLVEVLTKLIQSEVAILVRTTIDKIPHDLFPGPSHLTCQSSR